MAGILIIGGYGHVGRQIAARLIRAGQAGVRVAGRDAGRAVVESAKLGCGWAVMDLDKPESWDAALVGIGTVVVCVDLVNADFPAHVLERGLGYIDISATDAVLRRIEGLDELARDHGGCAVLSVGLAPGLSNLMARAAVARMEQVEAVTIGVLLGLGDAHGAAAVDWTLDNMRRLTPDDVRPMGFGPEATVVQTMPFAFADQHVLVRRHALESVTTRLGLASPLITRATLRLLARLAKRPVFRNLLRWSMARFRLGSDRASLVVEAVGHGADGPLRHRLTLDGRAEAAITALIAAHVALAWPGAARPGVWHIEEIWHLGEFASALRAEGITLGEQRLDLPAPADASGSDP